MKQVVRIILAAAAVAALAVPAMAADKLIVKDALGTSDVFKVTDAGEAIMPKPGVNRSAMMSNPSTTDNFAFVAFSPNASSGKSGMAFQIIPKSTGFSAAIKAQLSVFNTDLIADPVNYEFLALRAAGAAYTINASTGGTGLARPIDLQMLNITKVRLDTAGNFGIGTTAPTSLLDVNNAASTSGLRIRSSNTPASMTATCNQGDISWDSTGVYVCVAANSWKKAALGSF